MGSTATLPGSTGSSAGMAPASSSRQAYFRSIAAADGAGNHALAEQLRASPEQPSGHDNDYGAALGGPIVIPKVFNGRNKLFFFFSFDGFRRSQDHREHVQSHASHFVEPPGQTFSDLLAINATKYQIYDPLSVRPDPAPRGPLHPHADSRRHPSRFANRESGLLHLSQIPPLHQ